MNTYIQKNKSINKTKHILSALIIALMFGIMAVGNNVAYGWGDKGTTVTLTKIDLMTFVVTTDFKYEPITDSECSVYYTLLVSLGGSPKEVELVNYHYNSGIPATFNKAIPYSLVGNSITFVDNNNNTVSLAYDTDYNARVVAKIYDDTDQPTSIYSNFVTIRFNQSISLPADPVKDGYNFVGWYYDIELTQAYDNAPIYSDTNLYAKFDIKTYTANYYVDGEIFKADTVEHFSKLTAHEANKVGYNFVGWYTDSTFTQAYDFANATVSGAVNLYAKFEIIMLKVSFYLDDGTLFDTINVEYGSTLASSPKAALMVSVFGGQLFTDSARTMSISLDEPITAELSLNGDMSNSAKTGAKVGAWLADNWLWLAIGGAVLIGGGIFVAYKVKRGK